MKPQTALIDRDVGPYLRHQFVLADDFIRSGYQRDQSIQGARPELHRDALLYQKALARDEAERTEQYGTLGLRRRRHSGVFLHSRLTLVTL
jgi:hypothetical protein